jgi:hypothetical protein
MVSSSAQNADYKVGIPPPAERFKSIAVPLERGKRLRIG